MMMRGRLLAGWTLCGVAAIAGAAAAGLRLVAVPAALEQPSVQSIALLDANGRPLRQQRVEERFSRGITLGDVPPHVVHAILAAEDKRFFSHRGVDWLATGRAFAGLLTRGRVTSGASTITQQLVKIAEPRPRTFRTKIIESITALRLEQSWTKERILTEYLNRVDFGSLNIGIVAAADYYFRKPVADLSDAEAALLAGLPRNPRKLSPHGAPEKARARQQMVLRRMHENGWLADDRFAAATAEEVRLQRPRRVFRAPHFVDLVLQQPRNTPAGATELRTTLDLRLNNEVERIVRERLLPLKSHHVRNAAAVVIENSTGNVLALVGSEDYFAPAAGQVNGAWAKRSAGSTLKPFTYLLALENGATPASVLADVRTSFSTAGGVYRPENYNRRCYGPVRLRTALASSLNIPAVKVLLQFAGGPAALDARLRECGLTTLTQPAHVYGAGLTLGNCETRLLELTNAYASLARLGEYRPYRILAESPSFSRRYSQPEYVWQIADILSDNAARTLSFGIHSALRYPFPVACKTGTSTDFRDNWTVGFTPEFSVGVWVGNFDGSPMREISGVTGAAPILRGIFDHLHATRGTSWYARPLQVVDRTIHPLTGKLLPESDPRGVVESFLANQLPPPESPDDYDAAGAVKLSGEYAEWLASGEGAALLTANGSDRASSTDLQITSPLPGATYLLDPDVPTSRRIPLSGSGLGVLQWRSDSLRCAAEAGIVFAEAVEGEHRIVVTDAAGREAAVEISIRSL